MIAKDGQQPVDMAKWPKGYPAPMFPPSSFFDIEKVADKARRQQQQKAKRMSNLRKELKGPGLVRIPERGRQVHLVDDEDDEHGADTDDSEDGGSDGSSVTGAKNGKGKAAKAKGKGRWTGDHGNGGGGKVSAKGKGKWRAVIQSAPRSYYGADSIDSANPGSGSFGERKRRWGKLAADKDSMDTDRISGM